LHTEETKNLELALSIDFKISRDGNHIMFSTQKLNEMKSDQSPIWLKTVGIEKLVWTALTLGFLPSHQALCIHIESII
jgi:hypothetical protein